VCVESVDGGNLLTEHQNGNYPSMFNIEIE
jgi:hypothetical protein